MAEDMHELPISEIPGAYIIRKPKRPLLEVSAFPRGYEVRFDTDAIGRFIVEFEDGKCQMVPAYELTFLGSKELFDQYDWSENAQT